MSLKTFRLSTKEPHLTHLDTNLKLFDARTRSKANKNIKPGDIIVFYNKAKGSKDVLKVVVQVSWFRSFELMFEFIDIKYILPDYEGDVQGGLKLFRKLYRNKKKVQERGVIVFKVRDPEDQESQEPQEPQESQELTSTQPQPQPQPQPKPQPLVYKVSADFDEDSNQFVFWGRFRGCRYKEELSLSWLSENGFNSNYRRRCMDNMGTFLVGFMHSIFIFYLFV